MSKIDIENINNKKKILENARCELKKHFVCLDEIIDKIIDTISLWYIDSSLLERAPIICLWGATGTGKTDLIKKLVTLLNLNDQFTHISMNGLDDKTGHNKLSFQRSLFSDTDFQKNNNVLLLDEFQWFNSSDHEGQNVKQDLFNDLWDFFSEREIKKEYILRDLDEVLRQIKMYNETGVADVWLGERQNKSKMKSKKVYQIISSEDIMLVHKMYLNNYKYKTIHEMKFSQFANIVNEKIHTQEVFRDINCKNYLIFISGNLDEAYSFCSDITTYDIDADYYHSLSKQVNISNIKESLQEIFRDEHIARLGNNHVIFPTINKNGYEQIIKKHSNIFIHNIKEKHKIKITLSDNIYKMLYNNSVYPTQGARPIFTTINDFFNVVVSKLLLESLLNKKHNINIDYNYDTNQVIVKFNNVHYNNVINYIGDIDKIKNKENAKINEKIIYSVHEAGHCLVYSLLTNKVPNKVVVSTSTNYGGFVFDNSKKYTYQQYEINTMLLYGGIVAEEIVFGKNNISMGATEDIDHATKNISFIIRDSGIINNTHIVTDGNRHSDDLNTNISKTNVDIEDLASSYRNKTKILLLKNKYILSALAEELFNNNVMSSNQLKDFFAKFGFDFKSQNYDDNKEDTLVNFVDLFYKFKDGLLSENNNFI